MEEFTLSGSDQQWTPGTCDDLERDYFPLRSLPQGFELAQTELPGKACLPTLAMQANFIEGGLILRVLEQSPGAQRSHSPTRHITGLSVSTDNRIVGSENANSPVL